MEKEFTEGQYALFMHHFDGTISGPSTAGGMDAARRLARRLLILRPTVAYILVYACDDEGNLTSQALVCVDLNQE